MELEHLVEAIGKAVDLTGIGVIVLGALIASGYFLRDVRRATGFAAAYRGYRQGIGRAILLGLEFLVAADIIRTIAVDPTFQSVGVLALIVAVRTFLSFTLELEVDGRWPWQRAGRAAPSPD
jgi:uncharacterized membrane protein